MGRSSSSPPFLVLTGSGIPSGSDDPRLLPSDLSQRAKIAGQQMRYFGLVARKCSFSELLPSARRAGFTLVNEDAREKEARFRWALGEPDFIFSVSFKDPDKVAVVAESCGDIVGLTLVSHSHIPDISVEVKPWLGSDELGPNATRFREILLSFPNFIGTPAWANY